MSYNYNETSEQTQENIGMRKQKNVFEPLYE